MHRRLLVPVALAAVLLVVRSASAQESEAQDLRVQELEAQESGRRHAALPGTTGETSPQQPPPSGSAPALLGDAIPPNGPGPVLHLERSLAHAATSLDWVRFIGGQRALMTGLLEVYCAAESLLPERDGYDTVEVVLGVGCLIGATSLFILGARRLRPSDEHDERLARFRAARASGFRDASPADFAAELKRAARTGRRRRRTGIAFGFLNLGATVVLSTLASQGVIGRETGGTIAAGTTLIGLISLAALFVEGPAEEAYLLYERTAATDSAR